ncbi:hypothetical protein, partial [Gulbenkiania mobilis]|uniref:hypothetical protein n=1 Tax=Gulbenkiania mobilis TaxID=397457 RepID=UPI0019108D68
GQHEYLGAGRPLGALQRRQLHAHLQQRRWRRNGCIGRLTGGFTGDGDLRLQRLRGAGLKPWQQAAPHICGLGILSALAQGDPQQPAGTLG